MELPRKDGIVFYMFGWHLIMATYTHREIYHIQRLFSLDYLPLTNHVKKTGIIITILQMGQLQC